MTRRTSILVLLSVIAIVAHAPAHASTVRGIRPTTSRVVAATGGVLMIPLGATEPGRNWPGEATVRLADGSRLAGRIVWVHPARDATARPRRWSDPTRRLAIRAIRDEDDTSLAGSGGPYCIALLPKEPVPGALRVLGHELETTWRDPNRPYSTFPLPGTDAPELPPLRAPNRPDPDDPFAHWRWVLIADRLNQRPPPVTRFDELGALLAQHQADLWRIGLAHVAEASPGVADACRDWLTAEARDGDVPFATWVIDPDAITRLLITLVSFERPVTATMRDALAWCQGQDDVTVWADQQDGEQIVLWVINRSVRSVVSRWEWLELEDIEIAVELPPRRLTRVAVDRPHGLTTGGGAVSTLRFTAGTNTFTITAGPPSIVARPPGVFFPAFRPALTLADVTARRQAPIDGDRATSMHLRRRHGAWEAFFECRRPADASGPEESVTILIGTRDEMGLALTVPERGDPRQRGSASGIPEVHRKSWPDRWYARVVIPNDWLAPDPERFTVSIAGLRTHGDSPSVETTPAATVPWRTDPGRSAVELLQWD